jgi:hypothetical protein
LRNTSIAACRAAITRFTRFASAEFIGSPMAWLTACPT